MDHIDERTKKLKAGKEKLAAFLKKKSKAKKTDSVNRDTTSPQNEEDSPEVVSPSAFSVTDSDQFSFTSGDEWSAEESELKSTRHYEPESTDIEQNVANTERSQHTLGSYILQSASSEQKIISDIESALSKRDELISKLTQSLQASFWQNMPNNEVMMQVQALVEHVGTLQAQLLQADQSLQEQLDLHEASALALQAAKEQMLQLQFILNCKDAELDRIIQKVHKNTHSVHSYGMKESSTENYQESCLMCEQYSSKVKILEEELYNKIKECERWSSTQKEWLAREQILLSSASAKSQESVVFQESRQFKEHENVYTCESQQASLHEQEASSSDKEQLHVLELQLAKLKHEHHSEPGEFSMLKQSTLLEAGAGDVTQVFHSQSATQHSQCLSQIEHLTSLNLDLQKQLSSLSSVEKNLAEMHCEYGKLYASYQEEIQAKSQYSEFYAQSNAIYSSEKDMLIAKVTELQNEVARLQATLHRLAVDDNNEQTLVAQLQQELMQSDEELKMKVTQLAEVQAMSNTLRCNYESLEKSVHSYEEVITNLTQQLQAAERGQKDAELEALAQKLRIEQAVNDIQNKLKEKDLECKQYTVNIISLQDELLSNQHLHSVEISEKEQQLESIEEHITVLDSERAKLTEKVKYLEQRLKTECQQYIDNLQHVMAEKEFECKQYTENIVRLQDELLSFRHAHDLEISEKDYCFERVEEQLELLSTEKANLQQKVEDLEHKLAAAYQDKADDVSSFRNEMKISSNVVDAVERQNKLITTQNVSELQMLETASQTEKLDKELKVLTFDKTALLQKVNMLEEELCAQCKQIKETDEMKAKIESQLQVVLADKESLQTNLDILTTEMFVLKKNLQDGHSESGDQDLNLKCSVHKDSKASLDSATETELVRGLCSDLNKVPNISGSESKDLLHMFTLKLHGILGQFEHQQRLAVQYQKETEQLKTNISLIDIREEGSIKASLQDIVNGLLGVEIEFSKHIESFLKQVACFETQELGEIPSQAEQLEQKQTLLPEPDQEICQEALQAQLKSTISQWQKLQLIVQEKEIELHRWQDSFDEQQRISSSMMRSQEEQQCLLQAELESLKMVLEQESRAHEEHQYMLQMEIESLKTVVEQQNKAGIQIEKQESLESSVVDSVSKEFRDISNKVCDNETVNNDELAQKEIEISELKTSIALKESENSELVNSLTLFQEEIVNLKNKICDLQLHGKTIKENMKQRESEVGILDDSLYGSIDEKEIDLINWKIISESQIRDLNSVIDDRELEIDRLKLVNAEIILESAALKDQLEVKDFTLCDLKNCLANTTSEVIVLNDVIADSKAQIDGLKHLLASKESDVDMLRSTITAQESEINVLKENLAVKQTEVNALQHQFESTISENSILKSILAEKGLEKNTSIETLVGVDYLQEKVKDKDREVNTELAKTKLQPGVNGSDDREVNAEEKSETKMKEKQIEAENQNCTSKTSVTETEEELVAVGNITTQKESENTVLNDKISETMGQKDRLKLGGFNISDEDLADMNQTIEEEEEEIQISIGNLDGINDAVCCADNIQTNASEVSLEVTSLKQSLTEKDLEIGVLRLNLDETRNHLQTLQATFDQVDKGMVPERSIVFEKDLQIQSLTERMSKSEIEMDAFKTALDETEDKLIKLMDTVEEKESEIFILTSKVSDGINQVDLLQCDISKRDEELATLRQAVLEKESEISSLVEKLGVSSSQVDALNDLVSNTNKELVDMMESVKEKESEICSLKEAVSEANKNESKVLTLVEELSEATSKVESLNEIVHKKNEELAALKHTLENRSLEIESLNVQLNKASSNLNVLHTELSNAKEELITVKSVSESKDIEISTMKDQLQETSSHVDALNMKLRKTNEEVESMTSSLKNKDMEMKSLNEQIEQLQNFSSNVDILQSSLRHADEEVISLKISLENKESEVITLNEKLQEANGYMNALNTDLRQANEELTAVKNTVANKDREIGAFNEKFQEVNREVNTQQADLKNTHEELATLKSSLENKDIEMLALAEQFHEANSCVDILRNDLESANEELVAFKSLMVNKTLEINVSNKKLLESNSNVLMLKADLEKAKEELAVLKSNLESRDFELSNLNEKLHEANTHVNLLQTNLRNANDEVKMIKSSLENKDVEIISLQKQIEQLQEVSSNLDTLHSALQNANEEVTALKTSLETKDIEINTLNKSLQDHTSLVDVLNMELQKTTEELTSVRNDLGNKDMEISQLNEKLQDAKTYLDVRQTDLNNTDEKVQTLQISLESKEMEIITLNKKLQESSGHLDELNTELSKVHEELESTKNTVGNKDVEIRTLNEKLQDAYNHVGMLHNDLETAKEEEATLRSMLENRDMEIQSFHSQLQDSSSNVDKLHSDLRHGHEELAALNSTVENNRLEINNLTEQLHNATTHLDVLQADLRKANEELISVKSTSENKDIEISSLKEQLQETSRQVDVLNTELRFANDEVADIKSSLENKDIVVKHLKQQTEHLQEVSNNVNILDRSLRQADEELASIKISLENKESEVNTLNEKLQEANSHMDVLNTDLRQANEDLAAVKNTVADKDWEISALNEKFQEVSSEVNTQQADLENTHEELGALKSSLENKDIEMLALAEQLQEGSSCVDILRNDLESANEELVSVKCTLVKKTLEISVSYEKLQESNSNVQMLRADLERANEKLESVKNSLESTDLEICNLNEQVKEISTQVDVLLWDLRNVNEELTSMKSSSENKDIEISCLKERLQEATSHVNVLNSELTKVTEEMAAVKCSIENKEREVKSLNEQLQDSNDKVEVMHSELKSANHELAALQNALDNKALEISTFNERVQESGNIVGILQTDLRNANKELTVLKNCMIEKESEICALREELGVKECKISDLSEEILKASTRVEELLLTQNNSSEEMAAADHSLLVKESEMVALKEKLSESSIQISSLTTALGSTTDELTAMKGDIEQKESELSALKERHAEVVSQLDILNADLIKVNEDLKAARDSEIVAESRYMLLEQQLCNTLSQNEALQTRLIASEKLLALVTMQKNDADVQVITLQDQLEALEVDLLEFKTEHSGLKLAFDTSEESKNYLQSIVTQKERELSEISSQITILEQQIKEISHGSEIRNAAEMLQKTEHEAKEEEFEHIRGELFQEIQNLKSYIEEKESPIAELTASATAAKNESLQQEFNTLKKNLILEAALSALSQEAEDKSATIVLQELKLQEQAEEISQLTDKVNHANEQLQEINQMNISLQQLNEALNSESHAHLTDIIHQREALEQQVVEMESLVAQKEREISEIMQSAADDKITLEQLSAQHLAVEKNCKMLLGMSSYLETEILAKEDALTEQQLLIDEQSVRLNYLSEALTQVNLSINELNELNFGLKAEIDVLQENKCDLEQRISKLQSEFDSQELTATQFMVESKQLSEKLTQMTYDLDTKDATIFDLQHDCEMYIKEINDLKQELEQKDLFSISLKQEVESYCSLMERSKEEKEMLKANFDSCMEEVQQKISDQEIELKRLRAHLAEETKNVCQDQNQMKEIYEQQIAQTEEKLLQFEKQCERLDKELTEVKAKSASAKDVYEHQLSEQELHLQSTNSELLKLKDHLSKITNNHKCEMAGLKKLYEIQTNELEESCLALERTVAEQKRLINENTTKFNREKYDLEQNYEIQLSDVEEKRRISEMEISRLKKHLDEMKFDHEKDLQSLEKSSEARVYELEDRVCSLTNELEKLRKSMFSTGSYSEERQAVDMRVEELETIARDLQNRNSLLEDDIAMMRDQAHSREEEMKAVLKNAAEEQQRQTAELNLEILQLQQQLSESDHRQAETIKEYESQVIELQTRNRQLEEKVCTLEMLIEEDAALQMAGDEHSSKKIRNMSVNICDNTSLKTNVSSLNSSERSSAFSPMDLGTFPSDEHGLDKCLPPSDENLPIVEGFVAEPPVKFIAPRRLSQPIAVNKYNTSVEKSDFVEEQCDGFQLEVTLHGSNQNSDHPIHENVMRERFEPEAPDHFLLETLDEQANTMWQHERAVDPSPSHIQPQQGSFDFSTPEKAQRNDEFAGNSRMQDSLFSNYNNSNSNYRDLQYSYQLEKADVTFEKRLNDIKEELEEEYVSKMRQQEIKLTMEYETSQAEYKLEMEQHFAQRMKAVRYEWERKFNKALQKVQKELEKQHKKELKQLKSDQYTRELQHHPTVSAIAGESSLHGERDLVSHDSEGTESSDEVEDHTLSGNEEIADPSDVLLGQVENAQMVEVTAEKQPEMSSRKSSSTSSSTISTPTLTACSPVVDREAVKDEAESAQSELSDTSSAQERFLEELEEMSQQSSQDLPLEWELTSTVIEAGSFEREPEHQSVWEVFDGRCVRQDCQEVRHKFHTLYQWVLNLLGDGYDVAFDSEFKLLTELPKDDESNSKSNSLNQSEVDSVNSSDSVGRVKDISYAELLARVVSLELSKHRLEEELVAQIDVNSKLEWELNKQFEAIGAGLKGEITQRTAVQQQESSSVVTDNESNTCTTKSLSEHSSACQGSDNVSEIVETLETPEAQSKLKLRNMENALAGGCGSPSLKDQSVHTSSDNMSQELNYKHLDGYSCDDGSLLASDRNSECRSDESPVGASDRNSECRSDESPVGASDRISECRSDESPVGASDRNSECRSDESPVGASDRISECRSDEIPVRNGRGITSTNFPECNYLNVTLMAEHGSASSENNNFLRSVYLDGEGKVSWSHMEIPDLQDKELAEELSRLQHDLRDTKEVFSKESVLLQEVLRKDTAFKNQMIQTAALEENGATNANVSPNGSKLRKHETQGSWDMLGQKLTVCMEQNQMLEDENISLRKKIREQAAVINFLNNKLYQKGLESEEWQMSVNKQLVTLQNKRCEILQQLQDFESGKAAKLSDTLPGSLREESLRTAQEDLMARMEELDHLNKMLTQRQVELQHCEAERKHLEQLCLLKDETEIQLMKQKRLMEEQLAHIESHLTERETVLIEEKTQLLQELKVQGYHLLRGSGLSQTSQSSSQISSVSADTNLRRDRPVTPVLNHNSSQSDILSPAEDVDRQHSEAVEKLRAKLKKYQS